MKKIITITQEKLNLYAYAALLAMLLLFLVVLATSNNGVDAKLTPIGYDFYAFWSAGKVAWLKGFASPYHADILTAWQRQAMPIDKSYMNLWFYPPLLLYWLSLFWAKFPYFISFAIFSIMMFVCYFISIKSYYPRFSWAILLAFPALLISVISGQNGAISGSLMILGLLNLEKRPYLAGFFFGLLAFKPQLCLLIPFALLAAKEGKVIVSGVITLVISVIISIILFGLEPWQAFFSQLTLARNMVQGEGKIGFEKLSSLYSTLRFWGVNEMFSYILHGFLALFVVMKTWKTWAKGTFTEKAITLILGTLLITPQVSDYDYVMTALVFILILEERNFKLPLYLFVILVILWIAPFIGRGIMEKTGIPLLFISNIALFICVIGIKPLDFSKRMG